MRLNHDTQQAVTPLGNTAPPTEALKTNMQDRMATEAAKLEKWHVRYWATNNGKREGYFVMLDSQRNVSGSPLANCKTREEAQRMCDEHNACTSACV